MNTPPPRWDAVDTASFIILGIYALGALWLLTGRH